MINQHIFQKKMDRLQNWLIMIGWKVFLAEEVNVTVVVNLFLLLRLHWDVYLKKTHTHKKCFYCHVPDSFKVNNEHSQKSGH